MQKIYFSLIAIVLPLAMLAQMPNQAERPTSFQLEEYLVPITDVVEFQEPDMEAIAAEDAAVEAESGRYNIARKLETQANLQNVGQWQMLNDGSRIWRAEFYAPGAEALNIYFSNYFIPEGAKLFVYNADKTFWDGAYTSAENNQHGLFLSEMVYGERIVLEYYEPAGVTSRPKIEIDGIGYFYRGVYNYLEESRGGSDPCQVDINCPEGDEWQDEKNAVVRLLITQGNQSFLCTGALVNNTSHDCRQLMLTAMHCTEGLSDTDFGVMQVKFNFEVSGCNDGLAPSNRNRTGVIKLADSNDGGGDSGSDFALFEIEDEITDGWNPYFAGWRKTAVGSGAGVSIHHPSGDTKKISTYTNGLESASWGAFASHWRVYWSSTETNHGVTEGGSSGSPIFDEEHLIIGTLTGGASYCSQPNEPDYYGKMSYHWSSNGTVDEEQLAPFLDPIDTGELQVNGSYRPCDNATSVSEDEIQFSEVNIYPNPADEQITISVTEEIEKVEIFDALGKKVNTWGVSGTQQEIPVSQYEQGVYYITFFAVDGSQLTKKFVKR
ncbi:T9SS type A sorting domain-containing protein [Halocola ammonii]